MAVNPKSKKNLVLWPKGTSGNKKGRTPGTLNRATIARQVLDIVGLSLLDDKTKAAIKKLCPELNDKMTVEQVMTIVQARRAITKGDARSYDKLMDSVYGRAISNVKLEGDSNINIQYINPYNPKDDPDNK